MCTNGTHYLYINTLLLHQRINNSDDDTHGYPNGDFAKKKVMEMADQRNLNYNGNQKKKGGTSSAGQKVKDAYKRVRDKLSMPAKK